MKIGYKRWLLKTKRVTTIVKGLSISGDGCSNSRNGRSLPTSNAQQKVNLKNALTTLTNKINNNFSENDLLLTFTYDMQHHPTNEDEFKVDAQLLVRRIKALYIKNDLECKYIYVLEVSHTGRYHIHMILNNTGILDINTIKNCWLKGCVNHTYLYSEYDQVDYKPLACYLLKTSFHAEEGTHIGRRWNCSNNIKNAEIEREDIKESDVLCLDAIPEGYYVLEDSYYQGFREYDDTPFVTYKIAPIITNNNYYYRN